MSSIVARQAKRLAIVEADARRLVDTLTASIALEPSPALAQFLKEERDRIITIVRLRREHDEYFNDIHRTPMPRRTPSQIMAAVTIVPDAPDGETKP